MDLGRSRSWTRVITLTNIWKMNTRINLNLQGHLQVKIKKQGEDWTTAYDEHNAIDPNHLNIIRKALAGQAGAKISNIRALASTTTLAIASVTVFTTPVSPSNVVEFTAEFDEPSFNGTLDELKLEAFTEGVFSYVDNLSIYKDNASKLAITWKLTVNQI